VRGNDSYVKTLDCTKLDSVYINNKRALGEFYTIVFYSNLKLCLLMDPGYWVIRVIAKVDEHGPPQSNTRDHYVRQSNLASQRLSLKNPPPIVGKM
jgi:hypothetical protein